MLSLGGVEGAQAEAFDGGEDVGGGLGPPEGPGVGVDGVDVVADGLFKLLRGAMNAAVQLFFSEHRKEAFHLVQPGGPVGVKWTCQRGCRASQHCTAGVLWVA